MHAQKCIKELQSCLTVGEKKEPTMDGKTEKYAQRYFDRRLISQRTSGVPELRLMRIKGGKCD